MRDQIKTREKEKSYDKIRDLAYNTEAVVHFIGVGGVSMYSLARLTMYYGASVSGSDRAENDRTSDLMLLGAKISIGHAAKNVNGADLVVYTSAIGDANPEILSARRQGIITVSRAEYMAALMLDYSSRIGVSGSHGKSTTTAMLDLVFSAANRNPTVLSGADLSYGLPYKIGSKGLMIYEACEYKDSFLKFSPDIAIGLNLELDHTDYFEGIDDIKKSFLMALGKARKFAIINGDDPNLRDIIPELKCPVITFGANEGNDYRYLVTSFRDDGFDFSVSRFGSVIGEFKLNIPGAFNLHNATAAIVAALEEGIDVDTVSDAIRSYRGIRGRLEYIGSRHGRPVFLDYAHHPTEIRASVNALRMYTKLPLTVVFKPHTYTRTASLWGDFVSSLSLADYPVITDIFAAREEPIEGISSQRLAADIGRKAIYCPDYKVIETVDSSTDGAILLMGAGDFKNIRKNILNI